MPKRLEIAGERYGRLVALRFDRMVNYKSFWWFRCDCGKELSAMTSNVRRGNTTSCGCYHSELMSVVKTTHGHRRGGKTTLTRKSYEHAKSRCHCPTNHKYQQYGARGILMCDEWRNDFLAFVRDMGEAPPGTTIDRIDNDKGYEPGNCRWATPHQQSRNLRTNIWVEYDGRRMILKDFAATMGVDYLLLYKRVRRGQTPLEAATRLATGPSAQRRDRLQSHPVSGQ